MFITNMELRLLSRLSMALLLHGALYYYRGDSFFIPDAHVTHHLGFWWHLIVLEHLVVPVFIIFLAGLMPSGGPRKPVSVETVIVTFSFQFAKYATDLAAFYMFVGHNVSAEDPLSMLYAMMWCSAWVALEWAVYRIGSLLDHGPARSSTENKSEPPSAENTFVISRADNLIDLPERDSTGVQLVQKLTNIIDAERPKTDAERSNADAIKKMAVSSPVRAAITRNRVSKLK